MNFCHILEYGLYMARLTVSWIKQFDKRLLDYGEEIFE